ncbi:putative methyltransferase [Geobacter sp. OR-1]|uniref:class I SAM-dependent methyltransferase n=1 Tax=Geobacter sp. OR-1 TaxID=1266765 RepID=UPI000541AA71|nr:class I SAM-dependent methyltransferase [Geobacter sp. OR-1]GAM10265.1 putative methyltransferase [Geobacter sp. OR-1]
MKHGFSWQYDEFKQVGTDYSTKAEVAIYDSSHADFRDAEAESRNILAALGITADARLIDFGSGTGTFAVYAGRRCARVYAVDVSQAMIDHAAAKAAKAGVANIEFHHAGFLTYEHNDPPVDSVVTTFAFHHLPDFWKGIALQRVNSMLKPGGRLYLHDVILEETNALANITAFVDKLTAAGGERLREDTERHFREEYSTYDWVLDGLLSRAGFTITSKQIDDGVLGTYICTKN